MLTGDDRLYRAKILFALEKDLTQELAWLNNVSLKYLKNYQIWYPLPSPPSLENDYIYIYIYTKMV